VALQRQFSKGRVMGRNYGLEERIKPFHYKEETEDVQNKNKANIFK
jgi:hypothetical protein